MTEDMEKPVSRQNFDTLVHRILQHGTEQGERIALACKKETITYASLAEIMIRMGEQLKKAGIGPGDRVLYSALSSISSVATMLALQSVRCSCRST
jgi:long-chain acyl-CoA synthetase